MNTSIAQFSCFKRIIYACMCACILLFTNGCSNSSSDESTATFNTYNSTDYSINYYSSWVSEETSESLRAIDTSLYRVFNARKSTPTSKSLHEETLALINTEYSSLYENITTSNLTLLNSPALTIIGSSPKISTNLNTYTKGYVLVTANKKFHFAAYSSTDDFSFADTFMATFKLK